MCDLNIVRFEIKTQSHVLRSTDDGANISTLNAKQSSIDSKSTRTHICPSLSMSGSRDSNTWSFHLFVIRFLVPRMRTRGFFIVYQGVLKPRHTPALVDALFHCHNQ